MPRSRSSSLLSNIKSSVCWFSRNRFPASSILSTRVVLPWSTCAMMAMFLIFCIYYLSLNLCAKLRQFIQGLSHRRSLFGRYAPKCRPTSLLGADKRPQGVAQGRFGFKEDGLPAKAERPFGQRGNTPNAQEPHPRSVRTRECGSPLPSVCRAPRPTRCPEPSWRVPPS